MDAIISNDRPSGNAVVTLDSPLKFLKGVGPKRAELLARLELRTVKDLLYYFPRAWQDRRETPVEAPAPADGLVAVQGRVAFARQIPAGPRLALYRAKLAAPGREITAVWFKHLSHRFDVFKALRDEVTPGEDIWVVGRSDPALLGLKEVQVEEHYLVSDPRTPLHVGRVVPIYSLTEGVSGRLLRELVHQSLPAVERAPDAVPRSLIAKRKLLAVSQALKAIHYPGSAAELEAARVRLAYDELLLLELAWILKRRQTCEIRKGFSYQIHRRLLTPFKEGLGFELTGAQKRVINEIFDDMRQAYPMTRLLQGDVGSGKTVVAISALLLAVENGYQAAFMAPTEILADQHRITLERLLKGLPVKIVTLTSRLGKKERERALAELREGRADIVIGTHAVLEADVEIPRLKLAVIDEQHRFGVRQRATLRRKGASLDLLVMTATPIPRTLALALYGDLDVSTLDELPPGKTRIETVHAAEEEALLHVRREVAAGRQAYIVYPIIEESSRVELKAATAEYERLAAGPLAGLKVALIHGALPGKKKTQIMEEFAQGLWQALVATPVIEVGIDVANATVMVVQNADRFGMASLHQLRGRIGRGALPSRCYLVADPKTPEAATRIATLVASTNGFAIGEEDLRLRGPGEMLGTAQHGELDLRVADPLKDAELLKQAREDALEVLSEDPRLARPEHHGLRDRFLTLYRRRWNWVDLE